MKRFIYSLLIASLISTLAIGAEVRKLGVNDLQYGADVVSPAGKSVIGIQPMDVRAYGTALTDVSITAAIAAADNGATIVIPDNTYVFASTVTVNKPLTVIMMGTKITGPTSGYAFKFTVNDSELEGRGDAKITLSTGGAGGIWNSQALRTRYRNFKIDMNDVQNAIGFFHDGGWYVDVQNVEIEKAKTHATSDGIKIYGKGDGVTPGSTGSYGGSFVSKYENVVAKTVKILAEWQGASLIKVTTITFINLDAESLSAANALSITMLQPVMQVGSGGSFFTLENVAMFTAIGGDFEGAGTTVYTLLGSVRGINSVNNYISTSGSNNTYLSSNQTSSSYFADDWESGKLDGGFRGHIGALQNIIFRNSGYTESGRIGQHHAGDQFCLSNNGVKASDNTITLDNTGVAATVICLDTAGRVRIQYAYAASNPAALDNAAQFDNGGALIPIPYEFADNAAAVAGGLAVGRFYRTGDTLKVVH